MSKYPIFLELAGRRVVIVGGGGVAARKAEAILRAGARLVVVAERIGDTLRGLCKGTTAELIESKYAKDYLSAATLVIAATDIDQLNSQIYKDCQQLEILCNVVDSPAICDFYVPAVFNRGDLQIAIGTDGKSPAFAGHIRKKLEKIFTEKHGEFLAELESIRGRIIEKIKDHVERKALLGKLADDESFDYFVKNGPDAWRKKTDELIHRTER
ncbi:MAG: bifunctional precorrin-2 dehydrogenase/sirohydrochlorin ferrochelatase [Sedimentisphaerales bacterium]|nr:bifunctional precorrin-2 dehydrogenase/sirohydrochlorin ferrochelatase [Sedimentisphaerales bacterium]